uniref:Cytochrome c biogenesis protein CcsA n=1 Tax=Antithamnionella ternifolia TaxID=207919 RepID=A0A4D6WN94_9FLOR|nr:cytochrome c biogenesis protein ccs1 [Antithamnionella ternifolia]
MNSTILENNLINIAFLLILITLFIYWLNLIITKIEILKKISKISTFIINILLSLSLLLRWTTNHYFPLSNLYESLIFLTWGLTLMQLLLEEQSKSKLIGAVNLPIALFTLGFASLSLPDELKQASPLVPALRSNWLMMHVSIMMVSYASLIIGSLLSILFLIISKGQNINFQGSAYNKQVNNKMILNYDIIKENRLSLLESIDNLSYRIIGLGFPLLTIGIIAGAVWANEAWGSYWSWDPKETWALITWLIFAIYLHSRLNKSWEGKKPAIIASIGFIVVWICYLGVNFLGRGLHSYGWIF